MKTFTTITLLIVTLTIFGCGRSGTVVSGKVKFSDGEPVTFGSVTFVSEQFNFFAMIQNDGSYSTSSHGSGRIPAGIYRVYLQGTETAGKPVEGKDSVTNETIITGYERIYHVSPKYTSPDTSGLTVEVQSGGKQTFDVAVEKP